MRRDLVWMLLVAMTFAAGWGWGRRMTSTVATPAVVMMPSTPAEPPHLPLPLDVMPLQADLPVVPVSASRPANDASFGEVERHFATLAEWPPQK